MVYCIAHVGKSLLWTASDLLTIYLLVSVYAIDPIVAGAVFLGGLAANALADLGVGIWLGRHPEHAARLAGGALILAAATFPLTVLSATHGPWALAGATVAFRIAYAGFDVPHNALLSRLGKDPGKADWLARGRTLGTALASLLAAWGANSSHVAHIVPLLWGIALAGLVVGWTMVPLLAAVPLAVAETRRVQAGNPLSSLPLPFLAASVIGIVALGALAKAVLHLPADASDAGALVGDGTTILMLLIAGRTLSALIPVRMRSTRCGISLLASAYIAAAIVAAGCAWSTAPMMLVLIGVAMGATNLLGWALLPALADGPRGYGLYTMASKLALGASGIALAGGLGRVPKFTADAFPVFALAVAVACGVAALFAWRGLTSSAATAFPTR